MPVSMLNRVLNRMVTLHDTESRNIARSFLGSILESFLKSGFNLAILQFLAKDLQIIENLCI